MSVREPKSAEQEVVSALDAASTGKEEMALPLVVFFALQRYFVRGILAGSVKG